MTQTPDDAEALTDRAFDALNDGDLESAQNLATQLRRLRYSSYFEIQALIHLNRDEPELAFETLREGVQLAPRVWRLWQLLGNTLSDASDFDGAMRCYETALQLDLDAQDKASVQFNRATLLSRRKRPSEALSVLNELDSTIAEAPLGLQWRWEALRMRVLADLGRHKEVLTSAEALQQRLVREEEDDAESLGVAWSQGGFALLDCGEHEAAREWARRALEWDRTNAEALRLLRISNPSAPLATRCFQVMLQGDWSDEADETDEELGFFKTFMVVARTGEEAKSLALEMEAPLWETPPRIETCEEVENCDETSIGIYEASPYHLFPRWGEDEEDADDEPNSHP
ncbi:MAG: tetratricopeptide repeat protein [Armatimonadetes bacterium]|nr:tetratricopeptide repeat protein [Armatimonadota bacterium]